MIREDFHVHTTWCDGKDTPETIVEAALAKGMIRLGFSGHSHTPHDESYCMSYEDTARYRQEIASLQEKYRGRISIFCGIELDYFSDQRAEDFDYAIGSVHYIKVGDDYVPVDEKPTYLVEAAQRYFDGDMYSLIELYYRQEGDVIVRTKADLIGHFDLITKFNEGGKLFDENDPRYVAAACAACDSLLRTGVPFEVNTGAISRGWRTRPYPAPFILKQIAENGGKVVLSSDSHTAKTLCGHFDEVEKTCASLGVPVVHLITR